MTRLRHIAAINPATPAFDRLGSDTLLPFVPLEAVWSEGLDLSRVKPKSEVATGYTRFQEGDILVPKITPTFQADRATIARGIDGGVAAGTTELHVVRVHSGVDARYVRYLLSSREFLDGGEAEMIGVAGQKRVPDAWLRDLRVPITTVARQRAIADYLDTETARIDALIAKKQRMIELVEQRWAASVQTYLTADCTLVPLRRLLSQLPEYGAGESGVEPVEGWPRYIRITDIGADGGLRAGGALSLPPDVARPYLLEDGDLLLARSGATVGRSLLFEHSMGDAAYAGYLIRFRFDQRRLRSSLAFFWTLTDHYWSQVRMAALQATIENVSAEKFKDFIVPVPPLEGQVRLERRLAAERLHLLRLLASTTRQIELLREHRQALITAAVTGEIEVPGVAA